MSLETRKVVPIRCRCKALRAMLESSTYTCSYCDQAEIEELNKKSDVLIKTHLGYFRDGLIIVGLLLLAFLLLVADHL